MLNNSSKHRSGIMKTFIIRNYLILLHSRPKISHLLKIKHFYFFKCICSIFHIQSVIIWMIASLF